MRKKLGAVVQRDLGNAECLAHLPDGGPRAVANHVGHHGGAVPAVLLVHVLDDFFPPVVLDIEVDVGRLRPFPGQEPLEEQVHLHGVDRRHPQAVADNGVCGGSPPLAEDALLPAEPDQLPHRQEVPAVAQLLDERKLLFQQGPRALRECRLGIDSVRPPR